MIEDVLKVKTLEDLKKDLKDKKDMPSKEFLLHIISVYPEKLEQVKAAMKNLHSWLHPFDMDKEIKDFFEPTHKTNKTYFDLHKMLSMLFLFELAGIDGSHFIIDIHENMHSGECDNEKYTVYRIKRRYRKDD